MSRIVRSTVVYAVAGGIAAVVTLLFGVDRKDLVLDGYLVFLSVLLALAAARIAAGAFPRPRGVVPAVLARRPPRYRNSESLQTTEDIVALAQADNYNLHFGLRPLLQQIAADALSAKTGVDLHAAPAQAERSFEKSTWSLVRPDRSRPEGEHVKGIDTASLAAIVGDLERMLGR
jgi:hypothetical protein